MKKRVGETIEDMRREETDESEMEEETEDLNKSEERTEHIEVNEHGVKEKSNIGVEPAQTVDQDNPQEELIFYEIEKEEEKIVFVRGKEMDITNMHPARILDELEAIIGATPLVSKSYKSLKIKCRNVQEKNKLMKIKTLRGADVEVTEPFSLTNRNKTGIMKNRGIIFGVELDITEEEMSNVLGLRVERISRKRGGSLIKSTQMIIHFDEEIPDSIKFVIFRSQYGVSNANNTGTRPSPVEGKGNVRYVQETMESQIVRK